MASRIGTLNTFASLTTSPVSALDFNTNAITTVINDASLGWFNATATDTGSANNYIVSCAFGTPTAYNQGMPIAWIPANTNTGPSTITVNPLSSVALVDAAGNALIAGAIQAGVMTVAVFNGGAFRLTTAPSSPQSGLLYSNLQNTSAGTTTLTVNCGGFSTVSILLNSQGAPATATTVLLLQNVVNGAHLNVAQYPLGINQTFKFSPSCTDQNGNTIGTISASDTAGNNTNMIGTGINGVPNFSIFVGTYYPDSFSTGAIKYSLRFTFAFH